MADIDDLWYRPDGSPKPRCNKGKRWQARWRDAAGKQHKRNFERKRGEGSAEQHLAKVTADPNWTDPRAGQITLRDYITRPSGWLESQASGPGTRVNVGSRVRCHIIGDGQLGDYPLAAIRPSVVRSWRAGRARALAPSSVRLVYGTLSAILAAAVEDELIPRNPCATRSARPAKAAPRRIVPWTAGQVTAVSQKIGPRWSAMVITGAGAGLRQGELLGLSDADIDWLHRVIHVRRQVTEISGAPVYAPPKGGRERDVPLADVVSVALSEHVRKHGTAPVTLPWRDTAGKPSTVNLLFTLDGGTTPRRYGLNNDVWKPAVTAAGVPQSGPEDRRGMHALRHYCASAWLSDGVSPKAVAEYLGHSDPGFTLRVYGHLMPADDGRARKAIDAALGACGPDVARDGSQAQN